ncbi:MAG: ComEC/Rec2 family competence protein [Bdellovibrionota bacterium]
MLIFKHHLNSFCVSIFTYFFLYCLSYFLPEFMQKYGVLNNRINLGFLAQTKAKAVVDGMTETNLGLNFIGNFHKLSPFEAQIFQNSGLVHLLAISGGQILPVVSLLCFVISSIVYFLFKNKLPPHKIMLISSKIRNYTSFLLSFFVAVLFGGTGALMRVSWLNFFKKVHVLLGIQNVIFKRTAEFSEPLLDKFLILFIVSFLFGNIFLNYSFILSAIGAACAEISATICLFIVKQNKQNSSILDNFVRAKFFAEILVTIATCVFVGVVLSPLTYNSIANSCLANIFAIPVITFIVTPLALLVLITPIHNCVFDFLLKALDYSLMLFKHIAVAFSGDNLNNAQVLQNTRLFSPDGLLYLNMVMIILWGVIDLIRGRKVFLMRMQFYK